MNNDCDDDDDEEEMVVIMADELIAQLNLLFIFGCQHTNKKDISGKSAYGWCDDDDATEVTFCFCCF